MKTSSFKKETDFVEHTISSMNEEELRVAQKDFVYSYKDFINSNSFQDLPEIIGNHLRNECLKRNIEVHPWISKEFGGSGL